MSWHRGGSRSGSSVGHRRRRRALSTPARWRCSSPGQGRPAATCRPLHATCICSPPIWPLHRWRREAGPANPRSPGRVNRILVAVREFYRVGAAERALPPEVLNHLYELGHEPEFRSRGGPRARHRRREPRRAESPDQATAEEICGLLREASTARDQFLILLLALTGLRVGQALGLRRQDLHLVPNAGSHGLPVPGGGAELCRVPGEHLHVVRRQNPNGAWSKAKFDFAVPVPGILLALYDRYLEERERCPEAADNDMVIVALAGASRGSAMSARNLNKTCGRLARNAGLRHIHPHMLRHFAASEHLAAETTRDELQALLGWSHPSSAEPYIHVDHERRRFAVERLSSRLAGQGQR